ncbi:hypothetical protein HYH68_16270 [Clostridium botulinum]|uniref:hypothetical protein n=1 Tax=Clostridium botulinum TaxID=1491 RepID=UPI001C9B8C37|nr:hypothetical protein [Clostridium botulinum]MBY6889348.1 hypothetical protein [Clostridium botulinum]HDI3019202.1 hypothetical protein [Clostridium botulinum]
MKREVKSILLTFSERNRDVYDLIKDRDTEEFKQNTDYICNAIRFYEQYKEQIEVNKTSINEDKIEDIVLKVLKKYNINDIAIDKDDFKNIEENIDNLDIDIEED